MRTLLARNPWAQTGWTAAGLLALFLLSASLAAAEPFVSEEPSAEEPSTQVFRDAKAWVEETEGTISIPRGQLLSLRTERGTVRVNTGKAGEVSYRIRKRAYWRSEEDARQLFRAFVVRVRPTATEVRVVGEHVRQRWQDEFEKFHVEYEFTVPPTFRADLQTQGGNIEVAGPLASLRAVTAGGNIRAGDIGGETSVETAGGNIGLGHIGGPLRALTAGGDIHVESVHGMATLETSGGSIVTGHVQGAVRARTAGGDIYIEGATEDVYAVTAGGRIAVGGAGGRVQAETAGGNIRIEDAAGLVEAQTAGGGIELERIRGAIRAATMAGNILARLGGDTKLATASVLQTSFGDVEVYIPAELQLTIEAVIEMAAGRKIRTDFPLKIESSGADVFDVHQVRAYGELNGGGQLLTIKTVAGGIVIRKLTEELQKQHELLKEHEGRLQWLKERIKLRRAPNPPPPPPPPEPNR